MNTTNHTSLSGEDAASWAIGEREHPFAALCDLLPADVSWGDSLTPDIARHIVIAARAALTAEKVAAEPVAVELSSVAERLAEGDGFWRSCSGCHETNEGHETGHYPYSTILKCVLGGGCSGCGGIGAVWDDTDYGAMADAMHADMIERESAATQPAQTQVALTDEQIESMANACGLYGVRKAVVQCVRALLLEFRSN